MTPTMELIEISPEAQQTIEEIRSMDSQPIILKIKTSELYTQAAEELQRVKAWYKKLEEKRKFIKAPFLEGCRRVDELFDEGKTILKNREDRIKAALLEYDNEQERIRREEEQKSQEAARKREEEERKKLEAKAARAEANGRIEKAEELRQQAQRMSVPLPTVAKQTPKIDGLSYKMVWKARIVDFKKIPVSYLFANEKQKEAHQSYFNTLAQSLKGSIQITGIEFYTEKVVNSKTA